MIAALLAASVGAPSCPSVDLRSELLAVHEAARKAHLTGDAELIGSTTADRLVLADNGQVKVQSKAEMTAFFKSYFGRVKYRVWRDVRPAHVEISPDGRLGWMAVELEAFYTVAATPTAAEKRFKSSWIATYRREGCTWKTTGIASSVID